MNQLKRGMRYRFALSFTGLSVAALVAAIGNQIPGLGELYFLPLAFALAAALAGEIFQLWNKGIGFLVLFLVLILRYLISPCLIAISGQTVPTISASPQGMHAAVLIMCVELFSVVGTLWWTQQRFRTETKAASRLNRLSKPVYINSFHGLAVFLLLALFLTVRGRLADVLSHMSFALWISKVRTPIDTYDLEVLLVLKACFLVAACAWTLQTLEKNPPLWLSMVGIISVTLTAIVNILWYYHPNRSVMVYASACTIAVLSYCFPKVRKPIFVSGIVAVLMLAGYSVFVHTLQFRGQELSVTNAEQLNRLSMIGELYSNGVSTMAHSFDTASTMHTQVTISTVIQDWVHYLRFFSYPGLRAVRGLFEGPTTAAMFRESLSELPYILPNYGLASYYLGQYAGLALDVLFHVCIVLGIDFFYRCRRRTAHIGYIYVFTYCEAICGIAVLNNVGLMAAQLSGYPLMIFLIFWFIEKTQTLISVRKKV